MIRTNRTRNTFFALVFSLVPGTGLVACGEDDTTTSPTPPTNVAVEKDIVDTAVAAGSFNTLVAAVKAAGLVETLKSPGPFTVFAPTDAAFAKLPAGTVDELVKPENRDKLRSILTYHVVAGRVSKADASQLTAAKTVQGQEVKISSSGSTVRVGEANVVSADIGCTNGLIHVIDTVLLPQ